MCRPITFIVKCLPRLFKSAYSILLKLTPSLLHQGCRLSVSITMSVYLQYIWSFVNSSWIGRYEETPPAQTVKLLWSAIVSMYAVGGLLGSMSVRCIAGRFGRKRAMIWNNVVSIVAAVIMFTSRGANSFEMILIARVDSIDFFYSCFSPKKIRGMVTLTSATFISIGKLSGQFVGLREILGREDSWNILLCVSTCFSVVQLLTLPFFPEAPRYLLIEKGNAEACKKGSLCFLIVTKIEILDVQRDTSKSLLELLRDRSVRWQLITMVVIYGCIQFSGITAISVFSFDIFKEAGIPLDKIRYVTLGIGVSEVLTSITCVSGLLIESVGRRPLLWGGFGAMSAIMILITITLSLKVSPLNFQLSSGVLPSLTHEIFIQSCRPAAFVFTGILRWLGFSVLGLLFPFLIELLKSVSFVLFACMCLLASLYVFFYLPETKGKTLLEISEEFKNITLCGNPLSDDKTLETRF
uniref:Solute carrier family 2 member 9, like 1 n=1 Tax=Hucho hucho TaxID=62062 RepID=A0A4W5KGP9_9TELE